MCECSGAKRALPLRKAGVAHEISESVYSISAPSELRLLFLYVIRIIQNMSMSSLRVFQV